MRLEILSFAASLALLACSNTTGESGELEGFDSTAVGGSTSSSSSTEDSDSTSVSDPFTWIQVPSQTFTRSSSYVTVSAFYIAETEVTQAEFEAFLELPTQKVYGDNYPVANVSWYDAVLFCNAVANYYGYDTAYSYSSVGSGGVLLDLETTYTTPTVRLPTEAEWEVAARAGTTTTYYWGSSTSTASYYANYNSSGAVEVKSLEPNAYGLYDMAGNVSEWTNDWYSAYDSGTLTDPTGPSSGSQKVYRGGSWGTSASQLASDDRERADPDEALYVRGFRILKAL